MGLKYIYAGFSKCGTKTMAKVFRTLGFKVYDFEETILFLGQQFVDFFDVTTSEEQRKEMLYTPGFKRSK